MNKVIVDDRIMGSGKTYTAIQHMNGNTDSRYMYVTPFLTEVERIIDETVAPFYQPENKNSEGSKLSGLRWLVDKGYNIVTTHSLFHKLTKEDYEMFSEYELILDEVTTPIEMENISIKDAELLFNNGTISVDANGKVSWDDKGYDEGRFRGFRERVETNNVVYVDSMFFIWSFPIEIFSSFKTAKILTYLFNGSILKYYFEYNDIDYDVQTEDDRATKKKIKSLLNIYEGNSNRIGSSKAALSVNWYKNMNSSQRKSVVNGIRNVVRNFGAKSEYIAFTTFKDFKERISFNGYKNGFISINSRATNDYNFKTVMVYAANRYLNPNLKKVFSSRGVNVHEEDFALAEMIQWIWRGCIRDGKPMNLYIPSKRMRNLLMNWLNE